MVYEAWQEEILRDITEQLLQNSLVAKHMHGVRFLSYSKGVRRKRKRPETVTLIQFNGDNIIGRWRLWADERSNKRCPWDEWATEVFGENADGAQLRDEVGKLLNETKGRF